MKYHFESVHNEIFRYACNQCNYHATQRCVLRKHFESQHEGISYKCTKCGKQFTYEAYLRKHVKLKHESNSIREPMQSKSEDEPREYHIKCPECSESFDLESKMEAHFLQVHDDIKH